MKLTRNFIIQVILAVILFILTAINSSGNEEKILDGEFLAYNNGWSCYYDNKEIDYDELPKRLENCNSDSIILKKRLSNDVRDSDSLAFYSVHQSIYVRIDGELIEKFDIGKNEKSETPGVGWIFVEMKEEYSGKEIEIEINTNYQNIKGKLVSFYFGDHDAIFDSFVRESIPPFILCVFILIVGLFLCAFYISVGRKINVSSGILWLGIFSIDLSIWTGMETEFVSLFFGHYQFFSQLTFISLYTLIIPVINFIKKASVFTNQKVLEIYAKIWGTCVSIAIILQIFGIADLRNWALYCNIVYAVTAATGIAFAVYKFIKYKINIEVKRLGHLACIAVLGICVLLDSIRYLFTDTLDSAKFERVGFLIYIVILAVTLLKDAVVEYSSREKYKDLEEEAFHDALTKTGNRTAFNKDCINLFSKEPQDYSVIMFDLNNLKYYNDTFGHSTGDWYIIVCSEIIQDIFGYEDDQYVYRIGGDEFCAIVKNLTYEQYIEGVNLMNEKSENLNDEFFQGNMGIASGYAKYDSDIDMKFNDTIKRADSAMYESKLKMKSLKINEESN